MRLPRRRAPAARAGPAWDQDLPRVVGLLRAGLPPREAWARAHATPPAADTADPLERGILAAESLSRASGASQAHMLAALAWAAADRHDADALREAALAGPRLSARVLGWLPAAGLALAGLVDAGVWRVLALTPLGWGLLAVAGALAWAGRIWTRRIVARAALADGDADAALVAAALLRAALAAGGSVPQALAAVGEALGDDALVAAGARLAAGEGASPDGPAWRGAPSRWRELAVALEPAWTAGAPSGPVLEAVGESAARRSRREASIRAAELGVRVAMPLALCQLPAFVAVGVVPLLVSAVGGALGGVSLDGVPLGGLEVPGG